MNDIFILIVISTNIAGLVADLLLIISKLALAIAKNNARVIFG